jgi:hypothetical protein
MPGKLMSPLIRMGLRKQTREAAGNLRQLIESGSDPDWGIKS